MRKKVLAGVVAGAGTLVAAQAFAEGEVVGTAMQTMVDSTKGEIVAALPIVGVVMAVCVAIGFGIKLLKKGAKSS